MSKHYNIQPSETGRMPLPAIGALLAQLGNEISQQKLKETMDQAQMGQMGMN